VVSDRYIPSSLAYQGVARGLGVDEIERLSRWATGGLEADLVVVLDASVEEVAARRDAPRDRMERESRAFSDDVRRAYRELAAAHGWEVVDGNAPVEDVAAEIWRLVQRLLAQLPLS